MLKPTFRSVAQRAMDVLGLSAKSRQDKKARVLTAAEYWVYLPKPELPSQETVVTHLYDSRSIGPAEGLVLTDVRLLNVLVLRSKNQRLFRKDLLLESEGVTPELLESISQCEALARVCFISEEPVASLAYLRLVPHLCSALVELCGSPAVQDVTQQRLYAASEFRANFDGNKNASAVDWHVRTVWDTSGPAPVAYTLGLHKRGLPDLVTGTMEPDAKNLAIHLLTEAAATLWQDPDIVYDLPQTRDVEYFGQEFKYSYERPTGDARLLVKLFRQVQRPLEGLE